MKNLLLQYGSVTTIVIVMAPSVCSAQMKAMSAQGDVPHIADLNEQADRIRSQMRQGGGQGDAQRMIDSYNQSQRDIQKSFDDAAANVKQQMDETAKREQEQEARREAQEARDEARREAQQARDEARDAEVNSRREGSDTPSGTRVVTFPNNDGPDRSVQHTSMGDVPRYLEFGQKTPSPDPSTQQNRDSNAFRPSDPNPFSNMGSTKSNEVIAVNEFAEQAKQFALSNSAPALIVTPPTIPPPSSDRSIMLGDFANDLFGIEDPTFKKSIKPIVDYIEDVGRNIAKQEANGEKGSLFRASVDALEDRAIDWIHQGIRNHFDSLPENQRIISEGIYKTFFDPSTRMISPPFKDSKNVENFHNDMVQKPMEEGFSNLFDK